MLLVTFGAGGRTRTGTSARTPDFESGTSANSITPAGHKLSREEYSTGANPLQPVIFSQLSTFNFQLTGGFL